MYDLASDSSEALGVVRHVGQRDLLDSHLTNSKCGDLLPFGEPVSQAACVALCPKPADATGTLAAGQM